MRAFKTALLALLVFSVLLSLNGCWSSNTPPEAEFRMNPNSGEVPLSVEFDATPSTDEEGEIQEFSWDFGDGTTETGETASHTYREAGEYEIVLEVTDEGGKTATTTSNLEVQPAPPTANLLVQPTEGTKPLTVEFDVSESSDPAERIKEYELDFGDGNFIVETDLQKTITHTYQSQGEHEAVLTVTNEEGKTATDSSTIKIEQTPNRSPIPRIEKSESQGPAPLEVTFDASRSRDPDGEISNYKWDFGDGTTESGRKVIHTFQEEGSFVVKLRVTDEEGAVSTTEEEIVVRKSHYEIGEQAENGYIAMQLDSVETSSTIKGWEAETDSKFVILNLQIEALQDNQYPSKTFFLYLEDSSGEQHTVSLATGVIEDFFRSQILESGEQIQGQMAYQVPAEDDGPYYLVYSHPYQADLQFKFSL